MSIKKIFISLVIISFVLGLYYFFIIRSQKIKIQEIILSNGETILLSSNNINSNYESSDNNIATVDENGIIYGISNGYVEITVRDSSNKIRYIYKVNVQIKSPNDLNHEENNIDLENIVIPDKMEVLVGEVKKVEYQIIPNNYNGTLIWISSNEEVVKTDTYGNIKGIKTGEALVEVSDIKNKVIKSIIVTVKENEKIKTEEITNSIPKITFNRSSLDMGVLEKYTILYDKTNINEDILWLSNNEEVAIVNNGVVEAKNVGQAIITAKTVSGNAATSIIIYVQNKSEVDTISIDSNIELFIGEEYTFIPLITPETASKRNLTWTSSDNEVIQITEGVAKALKLGSSTITVMSSTGKSSNSLITVKEKNDEKNVEQISLDKTEISLITGETALIKATILPIDTSNKTIYWTSSNPNVASVENGFIKTYKEGVVVITATSINGKKITCNVTVKDISVEQISLDKTEISLVAGETANIAATISPSNALNKTIYWTSSDPSVATVNNGVISGVKAGSITITATSINGKKTTCNVIVKDLYAEAVSLNKTNLYLNVGETSTIIATLSPSNASNKNLSWTSSDPSVATVNNGVISGVGEGTTSITVTTTNGKTASIPVVVNKISVSDYTFESDKLITSVGKSIKINISSISPSNASYKTATYASSNTSVATVDSSGNVTGVSTGLIKIKVNIDKITKEVAIYVLPAGDKVYFLNASDLSDTIIVESNGEYGMIDAGNITSTQKYIKYLGIKSLNFFLLSHWHYDHYAAVNTILNQYFTPSRFYMKQYNGTNTDDTAENRQRKINLFNSWKNRLGSAYKEVSSNTNFTMGNFTFDLFNTIDRFSVGDLKQTCLDFNNIDDAVTAEEKDAKNVCNENSNTVVALASVNGKKIYLSGDITDNKICTNMACTTYINNRYEFYVADSIFKARCGSSSTNCIDIYKVAHHGFNGYHSLTQSNNIDVINKLNPKYVVASTTRSSFNEWSCSNISWCDPLENLVNRTKSNGQTLNLNYSNITNKVLVTGDYTVVANIASNGTISFISIGW